MVEEGTHSMGTEVVAALEAAMVVVVAAYAAMAPDHLEELVVNHPHPLRSHHLEACYAHPVGLQE